MTIEVKYFKDILMVPWKLSAVGVLLSPQERTLLNIYYYENLRFDHTSSNLKMVKNSFTTNFLRKTLNTEAIHIWQNTGSKSYIS